ncbi:MAG: AAA family ATPase [Mycoplasmataceae bacterium]|nr:AAA family ATPase [Mycoplasmataceae bacterium]
MKIKEIKINNFRNFDSVIVNPKTNLNYFIGLTGSGKSNFLNAVKLLIASDNDFISNVKDKNQNLKISLELILSDDEAKFLFVDILRTWIIQLSINLKELQQKLSLTPPEIDFVIIDDLYKGLLLQCYDEKHISKNYNEIWNDKKVIKEKKRIIDLISDDLEALEYYSTEKINMKYNFVQKFEIDAFNFFRNFTINITKVINKNNKSLTYISNENNINGTINGLISNFTDFFNFKQLGSLKEINTWEFEKKKVFDWFETSHTSFIKNNFYNEEGVDNQNLRKIETVFLFDITKLINIISWNKKIINLNQESVSFIENQNNFVLKKLLSIVELDINHMDKYDDSDLNKKSTLLSRHINNKIEEYWKEFVMEELQIEAKITKESIKFIVKHGSNNVAVDINDESEGLKQFLSIILSLDYSKDSNKTILLIDEPESHLHLASVISLRKLLHNESKKHLNIFISTNSVQMVDPDRLELFHLIEKTNMSSQIINIVDTNKKHQTPNLIKQSFGTGAFSQFLSQKYSFFVKNIIDKHFIEKFIKHYGISANVFIYYDSKAIEFIEGIKSNFYDDYFNDNCFFIFDGTNEAAETRQAIEKEFRHINWFSLPQIFPRAKENNLTIEYLYSYSLSTDYYAKKKIIEENWKNVRQHVDNKINTTNLDMNKIFQKEYIKPFKKLKMEFSNSIKNNKSFIDVSNEEKIKMLIVFLEERGIIITSY